MPRDEIGPTRQRILAEAMRLFGEQGYAATTVAEIEAAAGLSPGAGGLYRHFASKRELLEAGVRGLVAEGDQLEAFIRDPDALATLPLRERLAVMARAGLRRMEQERDLNRLLRRDLKQFPELLALMRDGEIARMHRALTLWLAAQSGDAAEERDWLALVAVLGGAVAHYWELSDIFGHYPAGLDEERFVAAFVELAAGVLDPAESRRDRS